jgi:hypothetical protein
MNSECRYVEPGPKNDASVPDALATDVLSLQKSLLPLTFTVCPVHMLTALTLICPVEPIVLTNELGRCENAECSKPSAFQRSLVLLIACLRAYPAYESSFAARRR